MELRKIGLVLFALANLATAHAETNSITVASTTPTEQSGLFGYLLPRFTEATKVGVKVVAVGTGQALDIGRRGDADVVFVHDKPAEDKFMAEGHGVKRFDVMYNDFVIVGPKSDPAHIAGDKDVVDALRKISAAQAPFISRGDRSGTHEAELRLWKQAGMTSQLQRTAGIVRSVRAWVPRSTWLRRRTPIFCRIAAPINSAMTLADRLTRNDNVTIFNSS